MSARSSRATGGSFGRVLILLLLLLAGAGALFAMSPTAQRGAIIAPFEPFIAHFTAEDEAFAEMDETPAEPEAIASLESALPVPDDDDEVLPSFDIVRISEDGEALVAGRADAGSTVRVVVDGVTRASVPADATGNFVTFVMLDAAEMPRLMWIVAEGLDGVLRTSDDRVIVPPQQEPPTVVAEAPADDVVDTQLEAPAQPSPLLSDQEGVRTLARPELEEPSALEIDSIAYGSQSEVILRGRSGADGPVELTLDGVVVAETETDETGGWQVELPDVAPGDYALSARRLSPDGSIAARTGVPFRREPASVVEAAAAETGGLDVITVQPGATLWGIARERYGDGFLYVQVFEANRGQIADPDLIYPGQVFDLPTGDTGSDTRIE